MSPSDVKIVPMTTDAAGAAFVAGQIDVAVTWEPYLSTAKQRKGAHVLVSSYAKEDWWRRERLFKPDYIIMQWRMLVARHVRGIQTYGNWAPVDEND